MIYRSGDAKDSISRCASLANLSSKTASASTTSLAANQFNPKFINHLTPFQVIFGVSSRQTAQTITINKSEFTSLNPSINNTPEGLLVGLMVRLLSFTPYSNEKVEVSLWGVSIVNNIKTHTVVIYLNNKLNTIDTYELPDIDNVIKPLDY